MSDLRTLERDSIYRFVESCGDVFRGARVLDYGSGLCPYRDLVESFGAKYESYDDPRFPAYAGAEVSFPDWDPAPVYDVVLSNQVVQYVPAISDFVRELHWYVAGRAGHLVLTGPTNWPEVENEDLHRFTRAGIRRLVERAGFEVLRCESRAEIEWNGEKFSLGWGVLAHA